VYGRLRQDRSEVTNLTFFVPQLNIWETFYHHMPRVCIKYAEAQWEGKNTIADNTITTATIKLQTLFQLFPVHRTA